MKNNFLYIILIFVTICIATEDTTKDTLITIDDLYLDFSTPTIAAHTILGVDDEKVSKPATVEALSVELLGLVGGKDVNPGIAFEVTPAKLFNNKDSLFIDPEDIKQKLSRNMAFSLATTGDSTGTNLAIGYKCLLVDKTDILYDSTLRKELLLLTNPAMWTDSIQAIVTKCKKFYIATLKEKHDDAFINSTLYEIITYDESFLDKQLSDDKVYLERIKKVYEEHKVTLSKANIETLEALISEYLECHSRAAEIRKLNNEKIRNKIKSYQKGLWNQLIFQLGLGYSTKFLNSKWKDSDNHKLSGFINASGPYGSKSKNSQWVLLGQFSGYPQDSVEYKVTGKIGYKNLLGNDKIRFSAEIMYEFGRKDTAQKHLHEIPFLLGGEFKIRDGAWFELAMGTENLKKKKEQKFRSIFNFKYALRKKRRFSFE